MTGSREGRRSAFGFAVACALLPATTLFADTVPARDGFAYQRSLFPLKAGPTRVDVDIALIAGAEPAGGLRDLRITDGGGREVPYLLVEPRDGPAEHWLAGRIAAIPATPKASGFEVDLGRVAQVDRIRLAGLPRPLLKRARLEGSADRRHYIVLIADATVFDLPAQHLVGLELAFPDSAERYLRLTWDDRSTAFVSPPRAVDAREVTPTAVPAPLRAEMPFERRPSLPGKSRFRIRLPAPHLPIVGIELSCGGGNLLRQARVVEPQLRGSEVVPVELGETTLRRDAHEGAVAADLLIPTMGPDGTEVELAVDDEDNPPLDLLHVNIVLSPQPWIYLETPSSGPLVASYGNPKRLAPRYDLEAARPGLEKLHPTAARWGDPQAGPVVLAPAEPPPTDALGGAGFDPAGFRYQRSIQGGAVRALAAVALDEAVLAHSVSLGDLRIRDGHAHQVPYLLERRDEPAVIPLRLERLDKDALDGPRLEPKSTLYRITLPFASLPPGQLVIATSGRVFQRRLALLAPRRADASPRDPLVQTIEERDWIHTDPDTAASAIALPITGLGTSTLYLRVDEGDNAPLPLVSMRLELPGVRLRFFGTGDPALTLLYGNPALLAPSYDLALLAPRLVGAPAQELQLGPEAANVAAAPPAQAGMRIFWGALIGAVVVLMVLLGRLLRREGEAT